MSFYFYSYIIVLGMTVVFSFIRFKYFDTATRLFVYSVVLAFLFEIAAHFATIRYRNNMPVYHIFNVANLVILFLYFFQLLKIESRLLKISALTVTVAAGIANALFLQPLLQLNSNILLLSNFTIIIFCMYILYKIMLSDTLVKVSLYIHFWFMCSLLFTSACTYFFWGYYEIFQSSNKIDIILLIKLNWLVNILNYLFLGVLFLYYKKFTVKWD